MIFLLRLAIIIIAPALMWLGWTAVPDLLSAGNMRFLGGIHIGIWGFAFHLMRKSADLINLPGLNSREQERLVWLLAEIRRRVWWIGCVAAASVFAVWVVGTVQTNVNSPLAPLSIGLLIGVGISYAIVIPGWFNEVYSFTEAVRLREDRKRRSEVALKQISDGKKAARESAPA